MYNLTKNNANYCCECSKPRSMFNNLSPTDGIFVEKGEVKYLCPYCSADKHYEQENRKWVLTLLLLFFAAITITSIVISMISSKLGD